MLAVVRPCRSIQTRPRVNGIIINPIISKAILHPLRTSDKNSAGEKVSPKALPPPHLRADNKHKPYRPLAFFSPPRRRFSSHHFLQPSNPNVCFRRAEESNKQQRRMTDFSVAPSIVTFPWPEADFLDEDEYDHEDEDEDEDEEMESNDTGKAESVRVIPRRKAGEPKRERRGKKTALVITKELLAPLFGTPLPQVASKLGIGATALKASCRKLGLERWPLPPGRPRKIVPCETRSSSSSTVTVPFSSTPPTQPASAAPAKQCPPTHNTPPHTPFATPSPTLEQTSSPPTRASQPSGSFETEPLVLTSACSLDYAPEHNAPAYASVILQGTWTTAKQVVQGLDQRLFIEILEDLNDLRDTPWRTDVGAMLHAGV